MRGLAFLSLVAVFAILDESCGSCTKDKFLCQEDECIFESWICDGHEDCTNGKDEESCGNECAPHHFRCSDGSCIENIKVCDSQPNCKDGADEGSCGDQCFTVEFKCSNGDCIAGHQLRCNGKNDCTDGSDEKGCDKGRPCTQEQFTCSNGTCIQKDWVCDGDKDCSDGIDEQQNCTRTTTTSTTTCSNQETMCPDGSCKSSYLSCILGLDSATSMPPPSNITALSAVSSNSTNFQDDNQQCLLRQGCLIKVMGVVFGVLAIVTFFLCGTFGLRYRNKVRASESQYLPLSPQQESNPSNEAFTMDDVP